MWAKKAYSRNTHAYGADHGIFAEQKEGRKRSCRITWIDDHDHECPNSIQLQNSFGWCQELEYEYTCGNNIVLQSSFPIWTFQVFELPRALRL